jgi:hypothetical protein
MPSNQILKSNNDGRFEFDGLWKSDENLWMLTCVHGNEFGQISLQWESKIYNLELSELRKKIFELTDIQIPENETLVINPCYPKEVKRLLKDEIKDNNIRVDGNWGNETTVAVVSVDGEPKFIGIVNTKYKNVVTNDNCVKYVHKFDDIIYKKAT